MPDGRTNSRTPKRCLTSFLKKWSACCTSTESILTRTLAKMASAGFITMKTVGRRKAPSVAIKKIVVEIDPYAEHDRLSVA